MALFAEVDDDPLSNDSYDPFANSLPSKKKKDTKNEGDTSSSLFANGGDDEDDDVFALKNNKEKVSSKSLFDEDSDGALGSISKQSKSKEENSGRSDDLGEFDFSKLDKLGTEKNKTKKKNSKKKKEFVDTGPAQRGGARSGALGIGHGLDEFDLSLKKKKLGSTHGIDKTGEDKKSIKKDDDIEVGLFDEDIFAGDIDDTSIAKGNNDLLNFLDEGDDDKNNNSSSVQKHKVKKTKDLFAEDDGEIDIDDLKTNDLMVAKILTTDTDDAGGLIKGKSNIKANIKELSKKTADAVLSIEGDENLNSLEIATKDKDLTGGVDDLFAELNFDDDKDGDSVGGDDLFAQIAALESGTTGNTDLSSIDAYIQNESGGGGGLFD